MPHIQLDHSALSITSRIVTLLITSALEDVHLVEWTVNSVPLAVMASFSHLVMDEVKGL